MKNNINANTRLIDLTVAELMEMVIEATAQSMKMSAPQAQPQQKVYVYGIKGIAEALGVSERSARRIKAAGTISKAIRQQGRTIVTDRELAIQLFGKKCS